MQLKGLGEPALALTLPKDPDDIDDGLLTASEIAELKLDAEWVVYLPATPRQGTSLAPKLFLV